MVDAELVESVLEPPHDGRSSCSGRCAWTERVVVAATASVYMHGFAIGRCPAGGECLGSLGDAREVFAEVVNMDGRAQRVRRQSTSRGTFGSGPPSTSRCGQ